MLAQSRSIIPPAPKVHAKRICLDGGWCWGSAGIPISTLPDYAFDVLISRRRILGLDLAAAERSGRASGMC